MIDSTGRTPADRIAAIRRGGPITPGQREWAADLLTEILEAAARYEVTLDDFDWVTDLPGACLDVVRRKRD